MWGHTSPPNYQSCLISCSSLSRKSSIAQFHSSGRSRKPSYQKTPTAKISVVTAVNKIDIANTSEEDRLTAGVGCRHAARGVPGEVSSFNSYSWISISVQKADHTEPTWVVPRQTLIVLEAVAIRITELLTVYAFVHVRRWEIWEDQEYIPIQLEHDHILMVV